jgi:5,10-methylene-tetrahydrofolate dehydrogenase/methenyl tetrahydrofolate cyclohydrolase
MEEKLVSDELAMAKDIDGISTSSLGAVFTDAVEGYAPCTAEACVKMLDFYNIPVEGKHVVVVGRSLVGINFDKNGKLCGDVDYDSVEPLVEAITPVPGGLGSVTTSVTMEHVVTAAEKTIR